MAKERRNRKRATKSEPKWQIFERTVAALERAITPGARVEHNVQLPNVLLPGETCQCDVVVRSGTPPRETLTIVEVQRRGRAVEANTFRGWCEKFRQVGAQHLICVSAKPFPQSIVRDAARHGPTLRLVTLRELEHDQWPIQLALGHIENTVTNYERVDDFALLPLEAWNGQPPTGLDTGDALFEQDGRLYSLNEIVKRVGADAELEASVGKRTLKLTTREPYLFVQDDGATRVHVEAEVVVRTQRMRVPFSVSSYEQVDHDGSIAWALFAKVELSGEMIDVAIIFTPGEDGRLRVAQIGTRGVHPSDVFSVSVQGRKKTWYPSGTPRE